jgi:tol-pal system protein YbgF
MRQTRLLKSALGAVALLWLAQVAAPAFAQDQGDVEPPAKRLERLEKQLREVREIVLQAHATGAPVEIKEAGPDPQVVALTSRLDDVEQTLRAVTGQFETLQHDLALARRDASAAKVEDAALGDRLAKLEQQVAALTPPPPPPAAPGAAPADGGLAGQASAPPAAADPKAAYAHARQLLLDGDYPSAAAAFQDYVDRFGDTADAVPARYWIGETKYIQEDYVGAASAYLGALHGWPQTAWAPDAVVKLSLSLTQLNKTRDACGALAELERHYPHASPATKARADAARQKAACVR